LQIRAGHRLDAARAFRPEHAAGVRIRTGLPARGHAVPVIIRYSPGAPRWHAACNRGGMHTSHITSTDRALSPATLRRRTLRRVGAAALLTTVLAAALWGFNRVARPTVNAADITVSEVRRANVDNTINAAGIVIPVHEEVVSSPGASRVARVHAKPGQRVAQGELLLELDDHAIRLALDTLREQMAQQDNRIATLTQDMNQKLVQTTSAIELLEIDLQAARVRHERNQKLRASGIVSGEDLMTAELNVRRCEIQLRQQRALLADTRRATAGNIAAANLQKAILQKQIDEQQLVLDQTRVRAPFAGMLTALVEDEGASVAAGQQVARVMEQANYRVEATMSDFHARQLAPGQPVRVEQNGTILAGTIHTILPEIQNGSMKFLVDLAAPHHPALRNKMRVDVDVVTERRAGVLVIDRGPAFNGRGPQQVFQVEGGEARKTVLDLGAGDGKIIEVVSGARAGQRFIVSTTEAFKDRDSIRVVH
jgi:HlyD family secretion protein